MHALADQVNELGQLDAVIHNVGVGYQSPARQVNEDGLSLVFAVNVLAPYALTPKIARRPAPDLS